MGAYSLARPILDPCLHSPACGPTVRGSTMRGSPQSRTADFGSGRPLTWGSTLWGPTPWGLHSGSLHPGGLHKARPTDFGAGTQLTLGLYTLGVLPCRIWSWHEKKAERTGCGTPRAYILGGLWGHVGAILVQVALQERMGTTSYELVHQGLHLTRQLGPT